MADERNRRPRISVCMPASRDHAWFRAALRSVLDQSETDFEVIVADDSGGALAPAVSACGDPRMRYLPNPRPLGFAANHCRAIDGARGDYVAFLHDDDAWEPGFLAAAAAVLDSHPEVGIVLGGVIEVGPDDAPLGRRPTTMAPGLQADPLADFLRRDFMMLLPSASLFRAAALAANRRPWPDVIAADLTMYVDAVCAGWKVYYLEAPLVRYRVHPNQIGSDDLAHRHALVAVWESYAFSGRAEALRRQRLASALLARAGAQLRRRRPAEARSDLARARRVWPAVARGKWLALWLVSYVPAAAAASARVWFRLRDPVRHRHRG